MAFASKFYRREVVIDSLEDVEVLNRRCAGAKRLLGRTPRDYSKAPRCSSPHSLEFDIPLIPFNKMPELVKRKEANKTNLSNIVRYKKIPSLDQNGTNYCWCNAVITALESERAARNLGYRKLSAASVAARIKGYSNQGGWGGEALEFIIEHGVMPADLWPENYWSSRKYNTDANRAEAMKYRVTKWYDLDARNFQQLCTCCLLNIPVPIGLNWWSHEVCAFDVVVLEDDSLGIRIRNSWSGDWGDDGFSVLTRSKATPDDQCAPLSSVATPTQRAASAGLVTAI